MRLLSVLLLLWTLAVPSAAQDNDNVKVSFTGLARACAGAVDDDTHKIKLRLSLTRDGQPFSKAAITLDFGDLEALFQPSFEISPKRFEPTPTLMTGADGKLSVSIRSPQQVSRLLLRVLFSIDSVTLTPEGNDGR